MSQPSSRRQFIRQCALFGAGAAAGGVAVGAWKSFPSVGAGIDLAGEVHAGEAARVGPEARLKELGLKLPPAPSPVATYVPAVQVGQLLYIAGHGPQRADGERVVGKVGRDLDLKQANEAARLVGLRALATVRYAMGDLDKVVRLVKTMGMVNATSDFTQQPQVINGFSDLMVEIFGDKMGKGARSAVGVGSLPGGIPVEIEAVFQVRSG